MKLNIMAPKDPEVRLAQRAQELIKKEKELSQKEKELKREVDKLYKDSVVIDNLREITDKKHSTLREIESKAKVHGKELHRIKKVLRITDDLLEKLPEEEIEKFVKSKKFNTYKKIIERYVK